MSGGYFDYGCFRISQFADDLQHEIDVNDDLSKDSYGIQRGWSFSKETVERLEKAQKIIALGGRLAKEVEWLYSGDSGEGTFNEKFDKTVEDTEL